MISAKDLALLSSISMGIGLLTPDENRVLTKISSKLSLNDLLSTVEESNLEFVLSKLATVESLEILKDKIKRPLHEKLLKYTNKDDLNKYDLIVENEIKTGLLAVELNDNRNISYTVVNADSNSFFFVEELGGTLLISLNREHSFYNKLLSLKNENKSGYQFVLEILASWGTYESSFHSDKEKIILEEAREQWGRELRNLMRSN